MLVCYASILIQFMPRCKLQMSLAQFSTVYTLVFLQLPVYLQFPSELIELVVESNSRHLNVKRKSGFFQFYINQSKIANYESVIYFFPLQSFDITTGPTGPVLTL